MRERFETFCLSVVLSSIILLFIHAGFSRAEAQTVDKNAGQLTATSGRIVVLPDAGCTLQPDCNWETSEVVCVSAPVAFNRGIQCANIAQALIRAATINNDVSDGGNP